MSSGGKELILCTPNPLSRSTVIRLVKRLQWWVPQALPVVRKADWNCTNCGADYYGERYCQGCHTGEYSTEINTLAEETSCAC
ncbi:hypothetical protein QON81_004205 [Salmonella enterica]|nr:hypothetical protein [Salmonella enterica]